MVQFGYTFQAARQTVGHSFDRRGALYYCLEHSARISMANESLRFFISEALF